MKKNAARRSPRAGKKKIPDTRSRAQRLLLRYGWLLPALAVVIGGSVLTLTYAFASVPLPQEIELPSSAEVYDVNGRLIGTYSDEVKRFLIPGEQLEELLEDKPFIGESVIAAEDHDFYEHNGVSLRGIFRATWANVSGGSVQQGGSTITQQYVKNAVLQDPSRTITRKTKEAILAIKMERRYTKDEILGFYLNTIYLGRGAYGIEAAARAYFAKSASDLWLTEMAYLAGIIPSPEAYQPDENPDAAEARRDRVLQEMAELGYITEERAERASSRPIKLGRGLPTQNRRSRAAYFMEWLRKDYLQDYFGPELFTGGLKIHTTLDLEMQEMAEDSVKEILFNKEDPPSALVSMTPQGEVRAMIGGKAYMNIKRARGFNYATSPPGRHAGSAFKPFTLLETIEQGYSPRSVFSGRSPIRINDPLCEESGESWEVSNYGGASYGALDLSAATANSVNTVFAQLVSAVGPEKVRDLLSEFEFRPEGGDDEIAVRCSYALGTLDVTPLEMARAYAGFANRGALPDVMPIRYVENTRGDCLVSFRPMDRDCEDEERFRMKQVVDENSADVLNQVLQNVVTGGTAAAANIGRPVAGKTGTSQNNEDAWFGGYTPQLVTMVWMGYPLDDNGTPGNPDDDFKPRMQFCGDPALCRPVQGISVTGGSFPARIWGNYMSQAVAEMEVLDFPTPAIIPSETIRPPIPVYTAPPAPEPEPEETEEPEPEETEEPEPEPTEEPEPEPTGGGGGLPTPGGGDGGGRPGGGRPNEGDP